MTELLALGLKLEQIIPMVTSAPAKMLGVEKETGNLSVGSKADITVLNDLRGRWRLRDHDGVEVIAERWLEPKFCFVGGQRYEALASILPTAEEA
tara:strand:- start:157 stop:441 length:285 start_codon:yes stop_codon:yes gene_type:complete